MLRPLAFVVILALAACEQSVAPIPPQRPAIAAVSNATGDASSVTKLNQTLDVSGTLDSPCTGEPIAFDGSAHIVMTLDESDAGATLNYHLNTQGMSGVGLVSGMKYNMIQVVQETASAVFIPAHETHDVVVHYRIISQGSLDNFLADLVYTFSFPPFSMTETINNARCGG